MESIGFKVLIFGLVNAQALFHHIKDLVISGGTWDGCVVYLDDIVVYGSTFKQHVETLS